MIAQAIGWTAASIALLCLVGLFAIHVLWPKANGQHVKRARHRDDGEIHGGAGSPGHDDELRSLRIVHTAAERRRTPQGGENGDKAGLADDTTGS